MLETVEDGIRTAKPVPLESLEGLNATPSMISANRKGYWYPIQYSKFLGGTQQDLN